MDRLNSRQKILLGCVAMAMAIVGDYLLGYGTFDMAGGPDAYMGIAWRVAPDWRYAVSSVLGFACMPLFAVAAMELMRVMEDEYHLGGSRLYRLFRLGNWAGVLYFAFIHVGICMLPLVFNAGMAATGDVPAAADMVLRVLKGIAAPLALGFIVCDGFATVGWVGMVAKRMLPVRRAALVCNPLMIAFLGNALNLIRNGLDSGTESLGWLLMYLVCALRLTGNSKRKA